MNEFENNNQNDTLSGFDSVDDNLYSKKSQDIIQDQISQDIPQYTTPPTYTTPNVDVKPQKDKKRKSSRSFVPYIITVLVSSILALVISVISGVTVLSVAIIITSDDETTTPQQIIEKIESESDSDSNSTSVNINIDETASSIAEAVATKCSNSVVGIRTTTSVSNFFGGSSEQTGDGSGVIYTQDGYIITNYHVISDAVQSNNSKIDVFVGNNKSESYPATVIGYNISCDLAVIKIDAEGLTPVELGNSDDLKIGQQVITIGAPGGIEFMGSVTSGIISGLDRIVSTNSELKLIQTDAAINPGNSGGALLDATGKLIGINSSKIASVEYEGMGFAIPVNTVKEKCDKIISRKDDGQAYLGVSISSTYTSEVLAFYGYPSGAVVSSVAEGSPAANAGIERGDIITKFNGVTISEYTVLNELLYNCKAGDTVSITIYRSGRYYTADIKLTAETSN